MTFRNTSFLAVGEAMIEMASVGAETYRRGFAGDTFNTAWHVSQIVGPDSETGFVTKIGQDSLSDMFRAQLIEDGLSTHGVGRDPNRTMGLYLIELDGVERSFHYWREASAARCLADDMDWLRKSLSGAGFVHFSGITLAILSAPGRDTLWSVLSEARSEGAKVSFDPNIRPRLWSSLSEICDCVARFIEVSDIVLPSFDDEQAVWGDRHPKATLDRYQRAGVADIVVKNGAKAIVATDGAKAQSVETAPVTDVVDTSGAGDAFNAGYLAARMAGFDQTKAIGFGQEVSAQVIRTYGARIQKGRVPSLVSHAQQVGSRVLAGQMTR